MSFGQREWVLIETWGDGILFPSKKEKIRIERLIRMTMTFLELHRFMKEDALLYSRIQKMFPLRWQHLEKGKSRLMHSGQVILVQQGLLVEEKKGKNLTSYCRAFAEKQLIFSTNGMMALRALEDTTYSVLPADILFDQLEEQKLLSNLFLQLQEDLEKERDQELQLQWCSVGERVELLLQLLIQKYQLNPRTNPAFPSWLNIQTLARFGNSSATMTSRRMRELAGQGIIDTKITPWRLLQPLPKAVQ
ncbi:Crp/Fnr family transcriptional regulator [Listeria monocytogenes]|nr:Crp/Fnr family transcriptional regulator [Listeria monocytogenes]EAC4365887.1 Crp/Fnr family transcriptional regulator [Listeria monocytogenes]EAC4831178.1 Crp/Fnr family transcriptional regulator [Listeria monocytogenes]EAC6175410.1 Crp/Fnr family transcriptional regulator [Listeria monocytogenes]EAD0432054.1 Crp/Fnr family transcriptional regulator [Listeria monocytogenes]